MIDLIENAKTQLEALGYSDVVLKRLDGLTGKEGIVLREVAYTPIERYYDGTSTGDYVYQAIVRRRGQADARETCGEVAAALEDWEPASSNGSYRLNPGGHSVYTYPQELELSESGFYAYEVRMVARIERLEV